MRRKSTRNAQKATPEKSTKETETPPKTRRSRRRKRSPSKSSDSEDEVLTVTKRVAPEDTPDTTTKSHTPTDDETSEEPMWKVTSTEDSPKGEIQKLKICLTRPSPDSPDKSKSRRKSSSQNEDDATSSEDKPTRRTRSQGSPTLRNDGLSSQEGDEDVEEKKGKGKSKGKHKTKIEKSPHLSETELQTNNEISENVQVTPQSPSIDNPVDNENDHKVHVDDIQNVNESVQEPENVEESTDKQSNDKDKVQDETSASKTEDISHSKESDDDEPLSIIQKKANETQNIPETDVAISEEQQTSAVPEQENLEVSHQEQTQLQDETVMESEAVKIAEAKPTLEKMEVQELVVEPPTSSPKESNPMETQDQTNNEVISESVVNVSQQNIENKKDELEALTEVMETNHNDSETSNQQTTENYTIEEKISSPVAEEKNSYPIAEEKVSSLAKGEKVSSPVAEENISSPVAEENISSPVAEENISSPVVEEKIPSPVVEEKIPLPVVEEKVSSRITEESEQKPKEHNLRRRLKRDNVKADTKENEEPGDEISQMKPLHTKRKWDRNLNLESSLVRLDLESLQNVWPTIDFPEEPDLHLEIEKERRKSLAESSGKKLERKVSVEYKSDFSERPSYEKQTSVNSISKDSDDNSNIIAFNRKISIVDDTASKLKPPPSPAKNPITNILFITNLVRPFTVKQLKELLERTGKIQEEGFWTDRIKSKCYVQYESQEEAESTRNALHGVQWPIGNGKKLVIDYATEEEMQNARNPPAPPPTAPAPEPKVVAKENLEPVENKPRPEEKTTKEVEKKREGPVREWDIGKKDVRRERSRSRERNRKHRRSPSPSDDFINRKHRKAEESVPQKLMDDLFLKTKATPSIYWQPLSPEEITLKQQQRLIRMEEHKRRMEETSRMKGREMGRGAFRRRYD